ncbi:MAG: hypothetical protein R6V04_12815 [bacterium]
MESVFLYLLMGVSFYLIHRASRNSRQIFKLLAYLETGFITGLILGFITDFPLTPNLRLPWLALAFIGLLAGLILYGAEKINFFTHTGLQYLATIIPGFIHAFISYFFMKLYLIISSVGLSETKPVTLHPLIFLLLSFVIFFGYTFPKRWFKREKHLKE